MYTTDLDYDVIIVGGGLAGLTAALAIYERDPLLSVLILEANAIAGGRARPAPLETSSLKRRPYDMGGHFLNRNQAHLVQMLDKLDIPILDYDSTGFSLFEDERIQPISKGIPIFVDDDVKVEARQFFNKVLDIHVEFRCRCVILAVPPKQLLDITFDPPLNNSRIGVLKHMNGKRWLKFVVTYQEQFWKDQSYNGDVFSNNPLHQICPIVVVYNISSEENAALTGLVDLAKDPHRNAKVTYDEEVLHQLAVYFGDEALYPLDYSEKFWPDGAYNSSMMVCPLPGCMKSFHEIRRPLGRLFFAGAETATYWYGHVCGAVQSGLRAALEVLYEIRPQVLDVQDFAELKHQREMSPVGDQRQPDSTSYRLMNILTIFLILYILFLVVGYAKSICKHGTFC